MNGKKICVVALAFGLSLVMGCGKKSDPAPLTKTQQLSAQKWLPVKMNINFSVEEDFIDDLLPDSVRNTDLLAQLEPCQKDNPFLFQADKTFTTADEGIKCAVFEPGSGTWSLSEDDSKFSLSPEQFLGDLPELPAGFPLDIEAIVSSLFADMEVRELKAGSFKTRKVFSQKVNNIRLPNIPIPLSFTILLQLDVEMK